MKIELIKYFDQVDNRTWWKITKDGIYITVATTEEEGIRLFDKYVARLKEPPTEPQIIKSIEL